MNTPSALPARLRQAALDAGYPKNQLYNEAVAEIDHLTASIAEAAAVARKFANWKGAPSPIGPLHGIGLTEGQNAAGKAILNILEPDVAVATSIGTTPIGTA